MPTVRKKTKVDKTPVEDSEITMPIPQINRNWYMPALVVLLIIASFLLGDFYAQLTTLKGGKGLFDLGLQPTPTVAAGAGTTGLQPVPVVNNVGVGHLPVKGQTNAAITMIEFADPRCPYCKQFFDRAESQLIKNYANSGKVKFYFREWPFLDPSPTNPASTIAANAFECANDQGYFWQYHDYIYNNQPSESDTSMFNVDSLTNIAGQLGLDTSTFNSCLSNKTDGSKVSSDYSDGQKAGVTGTPTFYINGRELVGALPYTSFQAAIDCVAKNGTVLEDQNTGQISCK